MESDKLGSLFSEIGKILTEDVRSDSDGAFLYAEVQPGVVTASIFKDLGNRVIYRRPSSELFDILPEAWETVEPDKRWATMFYTISGGRFSVQFLYPDDLDPKEGQFERRERVLQERYGDKPVDFSDP